MPVEVQLAARDLPALALAVGAAALLRRRYHWQPWRVVGVATLAYSLYSAASLFWGVGLSGLFLLWLVAISGQALGHRTPAGDVGLYFMGVALSALVFCVVPTTATQIVFLLKHGDGGNPSQTAPKER